MTSSKASVSRKMPWMLVRGALLAVVVSIILVLLFALLVLFFDPGMGVVRAGNQVIKVLDGDHVIAQFKREHMAPGEMEKIPVPRVLLDKVQGDSITIAVEPQA